MKCENCGHTAQDGANFCNNCGERLPSAEEGPSLIGEDIGRGFYRIVYNPIEDEFRNKNAAEDAAAHYGYDDLNGFKVELVRGTVPSDEYPFVCNTCRKVVSESKEGRCYYCRAQNWVERSDGEADGE